MGKLKTEIEKKLHRCLSITLITDGWTGQFGNEEYWAVAAQLTDGSFGKEIIILGMVEMKRGHAAEQTKAAIEADVNNYNFDKKKIRGKYFINSFLNSESILN
jgi:hypothetical protein